MAEDIKEAEEAWATLVAAVEAEDMEEAEATEVAEVVINRKTEVKMGDTITTRETKGAIITMGPVMTGQITTGTNRILS